MFQNCKRLWCFPWAVTAVGDGTVALRAVDRGSRLAADRRGVSHAHYCGAPTAHLMVINAPGAHFYSGPSREPDSRPASAGPRRPLGASLGWPEVELPATCPCIRG